MIETIEVITKYLDWERIQWALVDDKELLMKLSKGKLNPANAYAIRPIGYEDILFTIYDAINFVDKNGLRKV